MIFQEPFPHLCVFLALLEAGASPGLCPGGHVGGQNVVGVTVKFLAGPVIPHRRSWISVAGRDLNIRKSTPASSMVVTNVICTGLRKVPGRYPFSELRHVSHVRSRAASKTESPWYRPCSTYLTEYRILTRHDAASPGFRVPQAENPVQITNACLSMCGCGFVIATPLTTATERLLAWMSTA